MTVAAIERCLGLIEVLAGEPASLELGAIAARTAMPKSAAHRTLTTLVARGLVVQDPATQGYALSLRFATLAFRNLDARRLPDMAQTALDALAQATGEYCRLAVVEGKSLVWIARAQGATAGLRYEPDMGDEVVLHATATGKAWLATLPENEALRIVRARGFAVPRPAGRPLGPRSLKNVDELRRHLAQTRARGYAIAIEEGEPGTVALAIAFRADTGADAPIAGTLSVAGPLVRMKPDRHAALGRALRGAADEIAALWPVRRRQAARLAPMPAMKATRRAGRIASDPPRARA
jgi:DNA-binding IclR family transcriptional regulator